MRVCICRPLTATARSPVGGGVTSREIQDALQRQEQLQNPKISSAVITPLPRSSPNPYRQKLKYDQYAYHKR